MATICGKFKHGLIVGGERYFDFEMRSAIAGDLFKAEALVGIERQLAFNGALMASQIIRVGEIACADSISFKMIESLSAEDYAILRETQAALESEGK